MSRQPVAVLITIHAKPGCEDQLRAEIQANLERVRHEVACEYIVAHQDPDDPTQFMLFEEWHDRDDFLAFLGTCAYLQEYLARIEELIVGLERSLWDKVA